MSADSTVLPQRLFDPSGSLPLWDDGRHRHPLFGLICGSGGICIVVSGLVLVGLIALLDYGTGPDLSFGIFYLIPVALCAWYCGFAHGIIIALGGALAWHLVDSIENPFIAPIAGIWNGIVRFGTLVLTSSLVARLHVAVLRERLLARTDALTGAANGRTFYESAACEAERARRSGYPLTLAYFDLDNFKQLNDRFGHAAGDSALLHVVQTIQQNLRGYDLLARLGGDEFALLLPGTDAEAGKSLLTRLQVLLSEAMAHLGWPVALSIGAITFQKPLLDVDQMIQRVDALMYQAKRRGKSRVEHEIDDGLPGQDEDHSRTSRRATARVLGQRQARVREEGQEKDLAQFATIRNVSPESITVFLENCFPRDTLLIVEPLATMKNPLLARVKDIEPDGRDWKHTCELATRLPDEEVASWHDSHAVI